MNPKGLMILLGGFFMLLMARGVVPIGKDPEQGEKMRRRWGTAMKWLGPLTMLVGIMELLGI